MSGQKVVNSLKKYNWADYDRLLTAYGSVQAMVAALEKPPAYPEINAYHGHGTGDSSSGIHQGAAANRKKAKLFLEGRKPTSPPTRTTKATNKELQNRNQTARDGLVAMINDPEANLGEVRADIHAWSSLPENATVWSQIKREVNAALEARKNQKREQHSNKTRK